MAGAQDVDMKDAEAPKEKAVEEHPETEAKSITANDVVLHVSLVEKMVATRETRYEQRVWRFVKKNRATMTVAILTQTVEQALPEANPKRASLLTFLEGISDDGVAPMKDEEPETKAKKISSVLPEQEVYLYLMVLLLLIDKNKIEKALDCCLELIEFIQQFNRRSLDQFSANAFFYWSYCHEKLGKMQNIRSGLLTAYRTATLHHNLAGQAMLINLLLRNYLHYNLYEQADKLLAKAAFPEEASNNQFARYLYYTGRIRAVQLDYSEAHKCLMQAIRKSPQSTAHAFRLTVHKLGCIVQLLMGEIPEKSIFRQAGLTVGLKPYFAVVQAVRVGNLGAFRDAMEAHVSAFEADKNYTLIIRLRQNVIRAGLRNINLAYSCISLEDICTKLDPTGTPDDSQYQLIKRFNHEDAESIVAKAIRDNVIDASIDHETGIVMSKENIDIYSTHEPQAAFHKRINFCLNAHNEAVKAMRYPPDAHRTVLEDKDKREERQREEQELAQSLAADEDEGL